VAGTHAHADQGASDVADARADPDVVVAAAGIDHDGVHAGEHRVLGHARHAPQDDRAVFRAGRDDDLVGLLAAGDQQHAFGIHVGRKHLPPFERLRRPEPGNPQRLPAGGPTTEETEQG
ncbi:MAG: hypothetical protein ACK559_38905, partial [bacterium]